ncbi:MAG TPA: metal ABC transporter ATP-binding protein [Methylomirabilota bacterium]|nr:metal ABC transporter ATP-binding protein [Methylomirabilota bacterium]
MTDELQITLENLAVGYPRRRVLEGLNLRLHRGAFAGLFGVNGSGKTTLLKTLLGVLPPLGGRLTLHPVDGRPPVLGFVPQREALDPIFLFSAFEVALMGVYGRVGPGRRIGPGERAEVQRCLAETGAGDLAARRFSELSGGQKQRVLVARALATRPDVLLLDEPTTGLDPAAVRAVTDLLRHIHEQRRVTVLMVSHDWETMRRCVREVIRLEEGRLTHGLPGTWPAQTDAADSRPVTEP